jgi:3-hydroxyacyl-CoA dehydrogenase
MSRITPTVELSDASDCDLIVEVCSFHVARKFTTQAIHYL